jgi:hypothetical protein
MDNDDIDDRFRPSGMEQQRRRDDNDTEERFSISGAKIRGCRTDNYNNDDNTEHAGRQISDQPHQWGESKILRITLSKGRVIMEAMTCSTSTKGQLPPTKSKPTMTRTTMII